jgi:hypothetical protein
MLVDSPGKRAHGNAASRLASGLLETGRVETTLLYYSADPVPQWLPPEVGVHHRVAELLRAVNKDYMSGDGDLEEHGVGGDCRDRPPKYERTPAGSVVGVAEPGIRELLRVYLAMSATVIAEQIG